MRKFFKTQANPSVFESFSPYRIACMKACETVEGALALAEDLRKKLECHAPVTDAGILKMIRRQIEAAEHASRYRAIESDVSTRIPEACKRAEDEAAAAREAAEKGVEEAMKRASVAEGRLADFERIAKEKLSACADGDARVLRELEIAEAGLIAARDREDLAAMSQAAEAVVLARAARAQANDRNNVLQLEAESFTALAARAREDLSAAQALVKGFEDALHAAHAKRLAIDADRHTLAALCSFAAFQGGNLKAGIRATPSHFDAACFFFFQSERAPEWDGSALSTAVANSRWGGFAGLLRAMQEPDWSVFDADPFAGCVSESGGALAT